MISLQEKKQLKLGRGHESDVRFADVSISRWHATIHHDMEKNAYINVKVDVSKLLLMLNSMFQRFSFL